MAKQFLSHFPILPFPKPEDLKQFGATLGIEVTIRPLPPELPGYHCSYKGKKAIVLGDREVFPGVMMHSFLHEIREMIEGVFIELGCPTETGAQLEKRAEQFATAVRMNSAQKTWESLIEDVGNIHSKWGRWGTYILVSILMLGHSAGCALLPYIEDRIGR